MTNLYAIHITALCLAVSLSFSGCGARGNEQAVTGSFDAIVIVLGNEPLDETTPTVDMVTRVKKAVDFHKAMPNSLIVFTGGKTVGRVSEAHMMANIAFTGGVSSNSICLEEKSRTTKENAKFTARLLGNVQASSIYIVSKGSHLEWAMPIFKLHSVFTNALPLVSHVSQAATIAQMEEYLRKKENRRVRQRLEWIEQGVRGPD